jgi:transcriptional regulator GlxA family with amidase domain
VVEEHLTLRQRESEFRLPHGVATLTADEARARDLFSWGKRLTEAAARQPALFNDVQAERVAAEADMLETLLATLRVASSLEPTRYDRLRQRQSRIVKTVEAHALEHADGRLRVTDLCRVAAVSERTLECAFKDVLGLTPVAYLKRLRLHRVRAALLSGSRRSTTVSAEAMKWGFWHFGDFSRAYKACFGEAPSDTLRRRDRESRAP